MQGLSALPFMNSLEVRSDLHPAELKGTLMFNIRHLEMHFSPEPIREAYMQSVSPHMGQLGRGFSQHVSICGHLLS